MARHKETRKLRFESIGQAGSLYIGAREIDNRSYEIPISDADARFIIDVLADYLSKKETT